MAQGRSRRSGWSVSRSIVAVFVGLLLGGLHPARAQSPGMPDPLQAVRAGIPVIPGLPTEGLLPRHEGGFPFVPLDRDPTEGVRHGWVQTTSGKFGFRMRGLQPPTARLTR